MGRNNADFNIGRLWHGSNADIPIGSIIEPRGSAVDGIYSTAPERRLAFATDNFSEAADYGHNVYQVEYHPDETPEEVEGAQGAGRRFVSRKGFKVVGRTTYKDYYYPPDEYEE